jgi:hypothetical protein
MAATASQAFSGNLKVKFQIPLLLLPKNKNITNDSVSSSYRSKFQYLEKNWNWRFRVYAFTVQP